MKNPFQKKDHSGLIAGITAGAAVAIGLGWLLLTDSGSESRRQRTRKIKEALGDAVADLIDKKTILPKKAA